MKSSRFLFLTCFLIAALVSGASAQTDWKGFYIGGNVGGAFASSDANTFTAFSPTGYFAPTSPGAISIAGTQHISPSGFTGGVQMGANWQKGSWVVGAETDFGALMLDDSLSSSGTYPCCAPTGFTVTQKVHTSWLFTARPRIGYSAGHFLLYGTGGLAMTDLHYTSVFTDTFATAHENGGKKQSLKGWTAGGGVEWQFAPKHWSVKAEYLYADFGSVLGHSNNLTAFTPPISFPSNPWTHTATLTTHMFRGGFNYRF